MSRLVRMLAGGGAVRVVAAEARTVCDETRARHELSPAAATHAAEGLVLTALMSSHIKGDERVTVQIRSESPKFSFMGEIDAFGNIRARMTPSDLPATDTLRGLVFVMKHEAERELYRGITELETSLEAALAAHLSNSDQVDAILRIRVDVEDGRITRAGGFVVERLPPSPGLPSMSDDEFAARFGPLREADVADTMLGLALGKLGGDEVLLLEDRPLRWRCRCSLEKVEAMLQSLGRDELLAIAADGGAEVVCEFCRTPWNVGRERIAELLDVHP